MSFDVIFWGVRGTVPCPASSHMRVGGNTPCVEVRAGGQRFILDCGTGLRDLGKRMLAEDERHAVILLSHLHLDHIAGFPFFAPVFRPDFRIRVLCGRFEGAPPLRQVIAHQMEPPLFPVPLRTLQAEMSFEDFAPGDILDFEGVTVRTCVLNHPDGATAFRIDHEGRSVAYVTDTEHVPDEPDRNILRLIEGADLVIYDSTYTDEEWTSRVGWGHSTWQEGVRLCRDAGVGRLALFHHDPDHDDAFMEALEREARTAWPAVFVAREGHRISL